MSENVTASPRASRRIEVPKFVQIAAVPREGTFGAPVVFGLDAHGRVWFRNVYSDGSGLPWALVDNSRGVE